MRFVVAGTGRSGTKWCATVLRVAGHACGHEQVFMTGRLARAPDWDSRWADGWDGDSSLAAVPFLPRLQHLTRLLVVRHPLTFAGSICRVGPLLERSQPEGLHAYLDDAYPWIADAPDDVAAAIDYWIAWNRAALPHVDRVARIEDLHSFLLLDLLGLHPRWHTFPLPPVNVGPSGDDPTWDDLDPARADAARTLADELGYDL